MPYLSTNLFSVVFCPRCERPVRDKGQRVGRNPKTGQEVPILPRRVLVFRASNVLKSLSNGAPGEVAEA